MKACRRRHKAHASRILRALLSLAVLAPRASGEAPDEPFDGAACLSGSRAASGALDLTPAEAERVYAQRQRETVSLARAHAFVWPSTLLGIEARTPSERPDMQTPALSLRDVVARYAAAGGALSGHIVNVGAGDMCIHAGRECDEANELLRTRPGSPLEHSAVRRRTGAVDAIDFRGTLLEPVAYMHDALREAYRNIVIGGSVNAANIAGALHFYGVPASFDVLKYDADGQDCDSMCVDCIVRLKARAGGWRARASVAVIALVREAIGAVCVCVCVCV